MCSIFHMDGASQTVGYAMETTTVETTLMKSTMEVPPPHHQLLPPRALGLSTAFSVAFSPVTHDDVAAAVHSAEQTAGFRHKLDVAQS